MRDKNGKWLKIGDLVEITVHGHKSSRYEVCEFIDHRIRIVVGHINDSKNVRREVTPLQIRKLEIEEMI